MAAFVTVLLCSNVIGVHKVSYINLPFYGEYIYGAGVLFFPISYLFGDILTEVYGYARSRKVIWAGFAATALCVADGVRCYRAAAVIDDVAGSATGDKFDFRPDTQDRGCFAHRFLDGRIRQFVCFGQDEIVHVRAISLDADDRFDHRRRDRRFGDLLSCRVFRDLVERTAYQRHDRQLFHKGPLGGARDSR